MTTNKTYRAQLNELLAERKGLRKYREIVLEQLLDVNNRIRETKRQMGISTNPDYTRVLDLIERDPLVSRAALATNVYGEDTQNNRIKVTRAIRSLRENGLLDFNFHIDTHKGRRRY